MVVNSVDEYSALDQTVAICVLVKVNSCCVSINFIRSSYEGNCKIFFPCEDNQQIM